jgi:polyisoprenyl-phosphate glycosyltransferase
MGRLAQVELEPNAGDFRLFDRAPLDALLRLRERSRFLRGMSSWVGFRRDVVEYDRAARGAGSTKFPLGRMIRFALDGVTSFSVAPLHAATWIGFASSALALLGVIYALVLRLFTNDWVTGWTALFIAVLFVGGTQLLALGVIGEYIGRIYAESKRRPLYLVQERLGFEQVGHASPLPPQIFREPEIARRDPRGSPSTRREPWPDQVRDVASPRISR